MKKKTCLLLIKTKKYYGVEDLEQKPVLIKNFRSCMGVWPTLGMLDACDTTSLLIKPTIVNEKATSDTTSLDSTS